MTNTKTKRKDKHMTAAAPVAVRRNEEIKAVCALISAAADKMASDPNAHWGHVGSLEHVLHGLLNLGAHLTVTEDLGESEARDAVLASALKAVRQ